MAIATGTAIALAAAASAGGSIAASKISSGAAKDAAGQQTSAANYAADQEAKANAAKLEFEKQQAADDAARYEATQRANYAQYLTKYNAAKGLGAQLGVSLPDAPSYDTALGTSAAPGSGAPPAAGPAPAFAPAPTGSVLPSAISAYVPGAGAPTAPTAPALAGPTGFRLDPGDPLAPAASAAPTVTLRTADGRVLRGVPRAQVPAALSSGAQVIG
jgi:hypothetical protein